GPRVGAHEEEVETPRNAVAGEADVERGRLAGGGPPHHAGQVLELHAGVGRHHVDLELLEDLLDLDGHEGPGERGGRQPPGAQQVDVPGRPRGAQGQVHVIGPGRPEARDEVAARGRHEAAGAVRQVAVPGGVRSQNTPAGAVVEDRVDDAVQQGLAGLQFGEDAREVQVRVEGVAVLVGDQDDVDGRVGAEAVVDQAGVDAVV